MFMAGCDVDRPHMFSVEAIEITAEQIPHGQNKLIFVDCRFIRCSFYNVLWLINPSNAAALRVEAPGLIWLN
jgi:hypothetical protein